MTQDGFRRSLVPLLRGGAHRLAYLYSYPIYRRLVEAGRGESVEQEVLKPAMADFAPNAELLTVLALGTAVEAWKVCFASFD